MSLPRPLLLALVGAVLLGAAFFASRGLSGTTADDSSAPVEPAPESGASAPSKTKATAPAPATRDARKALEGGAVVTSGTFDLHVSARKLDFGARGSFQSQGLAKMPLFKVDVSAKNGGNTFHVGAVSVGERAYLVRDGQALVVKASGWDALTRARAQQAENGPNKDDFNGYSEKELNSFELQGRETLGGAPVLHFRGAADRKQARDDFADIANLLEKTSLDSPLPGVLGRSIRGGTVDFWVGAEDHIVRREIYRYNSGAGPVEVDYSRGEVNQPQKISAPAGASKKTPLQAGWDRDSFGIAFSALTIGVLAVETAGAESSKRSAPARKPSRKEHSTPARRGGTTPAEVKRAVNQHRIVILFFRQRGADDDAVASAVSSVRGSGVSVFTMPVGQAPKYADVGAASVVRAPTIVLLTRGSDPRIFEGFIDSTTLAQAVADAR